MSLPRSENRHIASSPITGSRQHRISAELAGPSPTQRPPVPASSPLSTGETSSSQHAQQPSRRPELIGETSLQQPHHPPTDQEAPTPSPFQPFFTLIEDASTSNPTTTHPSVTYIFSDDEHDPLTEALLRLQAETSTQSRSKATSSDQTASESRRHRTITSSPTVPTVNTPEVTERCILLTLNPDGRSIASAQSLSPDWHVDGVDVTAAPTLDQGGAHDRDRDREVPASSPRPASLVGLSLGSTGRRPSSGAGMEQMRGGEEEREREDGPLMLKVRGRGVMEEVGKEAALRMGVDGLRDVFLERMEELRKVVRAGEAEGLLEWEPDVRLLGEGGGVDEDG